MERKVASLILYGFVVFASCLLGLGCDTKSLLSTIEEDVRSATAPTSYTLTIEAEPAIGGTASPIGTVTVRKDSVEIECTENPLNQVFLLDGKKLEGQFKAQGKIGKGGRVVLTPAGEGLV